MLEVESYYRILDLEPGASPEEIHQGYIDLTWVWHPDRFVGHPRLQQKAQRKLQQLNEAHERLRLYSTQPRRLRATSNSPASPRSQPSVKQDVYKPDVSSWRREEVRTVPDYRCTSFKSRSVDDWLD